MAKSKREIDKDLMYSKIMPSGYKSAEKAPDSAAQPEPAKVVPPPAAMTKQASKFIRESGVQFKEKEHTILVNIMEKLVVEKLDAAFEKFNCCKCDRCKQDVAAIALNRLPPKYVVADQGALIDFVAKQTSAAVTTAIIQAILIVRANPRH